MPKLHNGPWDKVLWKKQSYPDNYVPRKLFLSSLKRNTNFRPYTYWPLVLLSCTITQHFSTIFIFVASFVHLKEGLVDPRTLILISVGCFIAGYTVWTWVSRHENRADRYSTHLKAIKSSILIFLALMSISPVLRTLSAATSSDSIWAISAILFILNALLADYSAQNIDGQHERLTSVLSMNAAVSASVVLASRLTTDIAVFALVLFSVQVFALFPILRHRLQVTSTITQASFTFGLVTIALALTVVLSWTVTCLFFLTFVSVTFLAPACLVWAQKFKNEIRGPWDVAVPRVN